MILAANDYSFISDLMESVFDSVHADQMEIAASIIIVAAILVTVGIAIDVFNKI